MSARIPLTFRIYRGDQLIAEQTLTQSVIKIGKVVSAHLRIDDESVSRMHAIIEVDSAGHVHVIDLGSTRGTFVNGLKVNKAKLESGDAMQLGALRVEIAFGQKSAVQSPAVPTPVPMSAVQSPAVPMSAVPMSAVPMSAVPMSAVPMSAVPMSAVPMSAVPNPAMTVRPPVLPAAAVQVPATPTAVRTSAVPMPFAPQMPDDEIGAKSIEVAAMLGDSVVGVKHCMDPKSGKISPRTWGTFAFGAACLLASTIAFYTSVSVAAFNKGGLDYWTHVAHRPAFAFRPETLWAGYDCLAFGGLAFGLVAMVMGLARMRNEKRSPYFRIGTAPGVELPLENAPAPSFPLVAPAADQNDFVFNYGVGMDGEMVLDGKTTSLAELASTGRARPSLTTAGAIELPIPARARIRARSGQTTFVVSAVSQPRRHVTPLFAALESRTMAYFAGSLAVHMGVWALLQQIPGDDSAAAIDLASTETVAIGTQTNTHEEVPPPDQHDDGTGGQTDGEARPMALESGQSGKPDVNRVDGHIQIKDTNHDPQMSRLEAIEQARAAGILGSMQALNSSIQSIDSIGDISSGLDNATMYGAIFGADAGESHGYFGGGLSGFERGGGCTHEPCGLIGTSTHYGTIGTGKHAGTGWGGPGGFGPGTRSHDASVPKPVIGQATGGGDLDKSIIRRYIKRNIDKIGFCYEHELLAHPTLEGTISVAFFITPSGTVKGSSGSGFDSTVASCVASVVGNIEFPKPQGGGGVQVNYPFTFRPAGQ